MGQQQKITSVRQLIAFLKDNPGAYVHCQSAPYHLDPWTYKVMTLDGKSIATTWRCVFSAARNDNIRRTHFDGKTEAFRLN